MSRQIPTFETFEPRLLMSATDPVDSLFASAGVLDNTSGMTVSADGQPATEVLSPMYSLTAQAAAAEFSVSSADDLIGLAEPLAVGGAGKTDPAPTPGATVGTVSVYPSDDNAAGTDFQFTVMGLLGDLDQDGDVDNADIGKAAGSFTGSGGTGMTAADGDVDGDGDVDNSDLGLITGAFSRQGGEWVAGTVESSGGVTRLVIAGTDGNDVITLSYDGFVTTLSSQDGTQTFDGQYENVSVFGFAGNDVIRLDYSLVSTTMVYAGDGNDTVYENSQGASMLYGGAGDDLLIAVGGGNDVIYGNAGTDSYWVDTTDTIGDVSSAETLARNVHGIASFYQPWSTDPASADYVSTEIDGANLRDPVSGSAYSNYADRSLFTDGPEYDDVIQGSLGDCYYLAAMSGLSDTDPNVIRQAITDLGDGTYAVRFNRAGAEVYLRLDADLPGSYAKLTPDGETWVMLMEKAYAFFRYGQNSYSSISGGWMTSVVEELTGVGSQTQWTGGSVISLADHISTNLEAGHSITLGSYSVPPSPIVGSHAYAVMGIEGSGTSAYVTVYNPWGVDGKSYDSNYNDGLLRLSISAVQTCFSAAVVSLA